MIRPSKTDYYLNIAKEVAKRGTCLRRNYGAIIVKDDQIISTGYSGAPRGTRNCCDVGTCPREEANIPSGERYELCKSVHAEQNTIINAARAGVSVLGGIIYLYSENAKDGSINDAASCKMCRRVLINAGLVKIIAKTKKGYTEQDISSFKDEDLFDYKNQKG
jgi:dCMP deaminase